MGIKAKNIIKGNLRSKPLFDHNLEEKKALEYLKNLINSPILNNNPFDLLSFACDVLGFDKIANLLIKLTNIAKNEDINKDVIRHLFPSRIPHRLIVSLIRNYLPALIEKRLKKLSSCKPCEVEIRFNILRETFILTNNEFEVLIFYYLLESGIIREHFSRSDFIDLSKFSTFKTYVNLLIGVKRNNITRVFTEGKLVNTNLLDKICNIHDLSIADWCLDYVSGSGKRDLTHEFFSMKNDVQLTLADFDISKDELIVLDTLMKSNAGHNILFYGEPGTGKTSLAKCLAKTYGKELFTVKVPVDDKHTNRLSAIYATIEAADNDTSLILVDEADEVLNTNDSLFFRSKTNKSWINTLMEKHQHKIIWITNRFDMIHPSTMRRFSFSTEFKQFNEENRFKVLTSELGKEGLREYFSEKDIHDLCRTYAVNAGGIINAIKILNIDNKTDREVALTKIKTVLKNHEKVTSGNRVVHKRRKDFREYSLEGLNCSENLGEIITVLKRYVEHREKDNLKFSHAMSLLLYGMPGTGKSEFAYYLGHILDKEVVLRRCSDIHSMWVGETEKNIAYAFREAQGNNSILFFDEADSFIFPRKDALRSWEKNFTNEILTQLESYTGIVIFATNDIDGLDHASLRRFRFKIEFSPLTPEGNIHFYNIMLKPLLPSDNQLSYEEIRKLNSIKNLTPGDFAVVREQFLFMDCNDITNGRLISALINEVQYKKSEKIMIGFNHYN